MSAHPIMPGGLSVDSAVPGRPTDREALEAYAERLTHHRGRLEADLEAAHLRVAWHTHERRAAEALGAETVRGLRRLGVMGSDGGAEFGDHQSIPKRLHELAAIDCLVAFTTAALARSQASDQSARRR